MFPGYANEQEDDVGAMIATPAARAADEFREAASRLNWFHSIDLGGGVVTKGLKRPTTLRAEAGVIFKYGVEGRTVLDIGAWDGYFSFEAARRGAKRVLATDHFCWSGDGWGKKAAFDLAREATGLSVDDYDIDPMEINSAKIGKFDVALFLGVLYHLKHPLYVLERLAEVVKEYAVIETHIAHQNVRTPCLAFYPGKELNQDDSNWFSPNVPAVVGMLKTVGFRRIEHVLHPESTDRAIFHAWK